MPSKSKFLISLQHRMKIITLTCKFEMGRAWNLHVPFLRSSLSVSLLCLSRLWSWKTGEGENVSRFGSIPTVMSGFLYKSLSLLSPLALVLSQPTVQRSHGAFFFFNVNFHTFLCFQNFLSLSWSFVSSVSALFFFFGGDMGVCVLEFQLFQNTFPLMTEMGDGGGMSPAPIITFPLTLNDLVIV